MKLCLNQQAFEYPVGKIVCVGRNYAAHAKELNNPIPSAPILFIKPASSAVSMAAEIIIPKNQGGVHHELEIAILIGKTVSHGTIDDVVDAIAGIGLGLDLTLRDVQDTLKEKGHPWERAKSFDGACPLTEFVAPKADMSKDDWQNLALALHKNNELQQQGSSADMLFPILPLIAHMSEHFSLQAGDVILTGTPAGVGPLEAGDQLRYRLASDEQVLVEGATGVQ